MIHRSTPSYSTKLNRDYNSNISCLPGKLVKNNSNDRPTPVMRRHQTSDIFNISSNYNSFKTSNRKVETVQRIFTQSNDEKKLIPHPKAQRPNVIRNVFESQITIV
jgi:hypothetical protein